MTYNTFNISLLTRQETFHDYKRAKLTITAPFSLARYTRVKIALDYLRMVEGEPLSMTDMNSVNFEDNDKTIILVY